MKRTYQRLAFASLLPLLLAACSSLPRSDQQTEGTANVGSTVTGDGTTSSGLSGTLGSKRAGDQGY
jgi:uncharacterized lipoprotein